MDDSCAVCAETLEWVAYGPCGHRDVCSTCVARLRFICDDKRCCICKTECNVVFVTKALGDYTRMIDFSTLPSEVRNGRLGRFWYHKDIQVFFDDLDQYRMIRAMCNLSCSVCDRADEETVGSQKQRFRNIDQLKGHLHHWHNLQMCKLCLEGRKVFICEQKLYSRAQLDQHIRTGDSEVDGTENERGGFAGHPRCEFCGTPFYGDNELYTHMTTEHFTCHFCQRQHPGQYEYYRNYDDLETHFGQAHFLCEDEACLAKKFIVFQSEAEFKRHNALEHGGRMSRSRRNAVLQIPTSFRYRSGNEGGLRRGRGRSFRRESSPDYQLSMAIEASLEAGGTNSREPRHPTMAESPEVVEMSGADPLIQPFEALATTSDSDPPSRYREALSHNSRNAPLQESYFPPLSTASSSSQQTTQNESGGSMQNTMAERLRRRNNSNVRVLNTSQAWPATNSRPTARLVQPQPVINTRATASISGPLNARMSSAATLSSSAQPHSVISNSRSSAATLSSLVQPQPVTNNFQSSGSGFGPINVQTSSGPPPNVRANGPPLLASTYSSSLLVRPTSSNGLDFGANGTSRVQRSSSASDLSGTGSFDPISDFPPVSEMKPKPPPTISIPLKVDDTQSANKALIEKIRAALDNNEDIYTAFKDISQEYRQGSIDTWSYFEYVKQFGLSHLLLDLARLLPDPQKRKELIEVHNASVRSNGSEETFWGNRKQASSSRKGKGKNVVNEKNCTLKDTLADNIISTVRRLQSDYGPVEGDVEVLEKDGYRAAKGKSVVPVEDKPLVIGGPVGTATELPLANGASGDEAGASKRGKKKTSKFNRLRLGEDSAGALLDVGGSMADQGLDVKDDGSAGQSSSSGLPARGVWQNRGGQKLFADASRDPKKR